MSLGLNARQIDAERAGTLLGLLLGCIVLLGITLVLLTGAGATIRVLPVALLFMLPVLGIATLAGWLAGLAVAKLYRRHS